MVTDVRPLKCLKAKAGIVLTPSPIVRDEILLQPSNTGKYKEPIVEQFSALKTTDVRPLQPEKAYSPIDVTELGMVTDVRPLQSKKAHSPIFVTELGIITDIRPLQPLKA